MPSKSFVETFRRKISSRLQNVDWYTKECSKALHALLESGFGWSRRHQLANGQRTWLKKVLRSVGIGMEWQIPLLDRLEYNIQFAYVNAPAWLHYGLWSLHCQVHRRKFIDWTGPERDSSAKTIKKSALTSFGLFWAEAALLPNCRPNVIIKR